MIAELEVGSPRDQGEQEHDDAEGTFAQAVHQPAQGKVIRRDFVVQSLQHRMLELAQSRRELTSVSTQASLLNFHIATEAMPPLKYRKLANRWIGRPPV